MTRIEIAEKLKDILKMAMGDNADAIENCTESSDLMIDLGLSSVGVLYVVIAIEEYFNIRFDNIGFGDFKTVGDVITYIENKIN